MLVPSLILVLLAAASTPPSAPGKLAGRVAEISRGLDAEIGVAVLELETGRRFSIRGGDRFPMGSVFKFPVSIEVLRRVDSRQLRLEDSVTLQPRDLHPGFSPIRDAAGGKAVTMTVEKVIDAALRDSDNSAGDFLMKTVGGPAVMTSRMRTLGITGMRIDRSEAQMAADLWQVRGLPPENEWTPEMFALLEKNTTTPARKAGAAEFARDPRDTATPDAIVELLARLQQGTLGLSSASHARLLRLMTETGTGKNRIRSILPDGMSLAHKTGTMPGTINDAGIIALPNGHHLILVILMKRVQTSTEAAERVMAAVAKAVVEEMAGK